MRAASTGFSISPEAQQSNGEDCAGISTKSAASGAERRQPGDARRAIDDDVIGVTGEFRRFAMKRVAGKLDDTEQLAKSFLRALFGPVEGGALWVGVDEHDPLSFPGPFASEMQCVRRLADAALLVEERHDHRGRLGVIHRSGRSPTSEELDSCRLDSKLGGSEAVGLFEENRDSGS